MSASREKRLRREIREAELNPDIVTKEKKKKKQLTVMQSQRLYSIIGSAILIAVVAVFALLILVNSGLFQKNATAATVNDHKITPAEFNYFYQDTYYNVQYSMSSYWSYMVDTTKPVEDQECVLSGDGSTWKDYLTDSALASAEQMYTLCDAAAEAGYTLDETAQATLDALPATLESYAESYDLKDANEYLEAYYGKGATVESYMEYMELQQIAAGYSAEKAESFTYESAALRQHYNEHKQEFDKVAYRVFNVSTEDGDSAAAKETADAMAAELDSTEQSFIDAAYSYAPEESKTYYEDEDYTLRKYGYSSISTDYADWLFAEERVAGETQVFATSTGYAVIMFVERDTNDYSTVNVRHILVQVAADEEGVSTDADWTACEEAMDEIVAQWEASDMTEETFAAMADEKSQDTGSVGNGGLYEGVYKGQMVSEFEDWCFDELRMKGDYGVVKTSYGYHLMYFSGTGDEYWKSIADASIRSDDYNAWYEEYNASYEAKTKTFGQWFTRKDLAY